MRGWAEAWEEVRSVSKLLTYFTYLRGRRRGRRTFSPSDRLLTLLTYVGGGVRGGVGGAGGAGAGRRRTFSPSDRAMKPSTHLARVKGTDVMGYHAQRISVAGSARRPPLGI